MNNNYRNNNYSDDYRYKSYQNNQSGYNPGWNQNQGAMSSFYKSRSQSTITMSDFVRMVYSWMFIGLGITFGIGIILLYHAEQTIRFLTDHMEIYFGVAIAEVILVFVLGFVVYKLPSPVCLVLFFLYSAVNGVTIAPALIFYGAESAFLALAVTAGIFGIMSLVGMVTKINLAGIAPVLLCGLIGLIIYSLIAVFFHMPMADLVISIIGILLFIGFTAWDTQKIKQYYTSLQGNDNLLKKSAIISALDLYLDFINLFLYILRLFSRER